MNLTKTISTILLSLKKARRPAVLWSGGKDSTVLLDLTRKAYPSIEVIHWKLPFLPQKYQHHHKVQESTGMTVHDWAPKSIALTHGNGRIDVCETYCVGDGEIKVMRGTESFEEGKPWICGKDWINRPKSQTEAQFDVLLCGHKSVDEDPITGAIPLEIDMKLVGPGTQMWFPLRNWTDDDIAYYIKQNDISYDKNRYSEDVVSIKDKHLNSDYVHSCFRCIDKRESAFVHCPKYNIKIENIHRLVLHEEPVMPYCNVRSGLQDLRSVLLPQMELANSEKR
jgi:3'-phosphoadenosine 5'-phosphosulfate sulfotransferase (PAPS reductase)/FAD synthetase